MYMYVDYDAAVGNVRMNQSTVLQRPQSYPIQINYQSASTKVKIILIYIILNGKETVIIIPNTLDGKRLNVWLMLRYWP